MSSHSRCGPVWNAWMLRRYCSGPGRPVQGAPVWWRDTPVGVWGTYGWTGGAAPQASRERTPGGRGASAGAGAGADSVIELGPKVPSQGGFGLKIGESDGAEGGCSDGGCEPDCWAAW